MGVALLVVQLIAMVVYNALQYQRASLTNDFGGYVQAWRAIGHGQLNPWVSIFGVHFLQNNFDLAVYPVALLGRLIPDPQLLCWTQDLAVAGAGLVILNWAAEVVRRDTSMVRRGDLVVATAAIALFIDPWSYATAAFPVHFEAVATFFAVLAARSLWRGERRVLIVWVLFAMASEALGSAYVLAVGMAGVLAGRDTRRAGAAVGFVGCGGLIAVMRAGVVGRGQATIGQIYGYLDPGAHGHFGLSSLLVGIFVHHAAAIRVLSTHATYLLAYLLAAGVIGVVSPWGATMFLCVILPNALSASASFIDFGGAFQNWPAEPFLTIGGVMVLCRIAAEGHVVARWVYSVRRLAAAVAIGFVGAEIALAAMAVPRVASEWILGAADGEALQAVVAAVPKGAEVIGDQGVVGAFGADVDTYSLDAEQERFPVDRRTIVLVVMPGFSARDRSIALTAKQRFGAHDLVRYAHIEALVWSTSGHGSVMIGPGT